MIIVLISLLGVLIFVCSTPILALTHQESNMVCWTIPHLVAMSFSFNPPVTGFPIVTTPIFVTKTTPLGPSKEVQLAKYLLLKLPARQVEVGWLTLRECNVAGKSAIYGHAPSNGGVIIWNMLVITNLWMIFPAIKSPASWRISDL